MFLQRTDAAFFRSLQLREIMKGLFPPHSNPTFFMFDCPEYCRIFLPTSEEPVKKMPWTCGCSASACPATSPNPGTTLNTPGGTPASSASFATFRIERDDSSAGF